jgi:hypothetical protein
MDGIVDAIRGAGAFPLTEIGFMLEALSTHPTPHMNTGVYTLDGGCFYPPKDYPKWGALITAWVTHGNGRYPNVAASWLWELWNERDNDYWHRAGRLQAARKPGRHAAARRQQRGRDAGGDSGERRPRRGANRCRRARQRRADGRRSQWQRRLEHRPRQHGRGQHGHGRRWRSGLCRRRWLGQDRRERLLLRPCPRRSIAAAASSDCVRPRPGSCRRAAATAPAETRASLPRLVTRLPPQPAAGGPSDGEPRPRGSSVGAPSRRACRSQPHTTKSMASSTSPGAQYRTS